MLKSFVYVCFALALYCQTISETEARRRQKTKSRDDTQSWDYLVFTQQWPPATCIQAENSGKHCLLDINFNIWTIHGLWPNSNSSSGNRDPEFCESPQNFKYSNISSISQQLKLKWPTYFSVDPTSFWRHEWVKHGSCAMDHSSLNTLYKYFKKGLELHDQYNMYKVLRQAGISPNKDRTIKAADVQIKVNQALGKSVLIRCTRTEALPRPMLASVVLCFDKSLRLINCTDRKSSCYGDIFYWPV